MKFKKLIVLVVISFILAACSNVDKAAQELKDNDTNKAQAKVDPVESTVASPSPSASSTETAAAAKDFWTVYDNAKWSDDFNGLKTEIQKVAVSDKAPSMEEPNKFDHSLVGVKFKIENTTKKLFTTYPDQAVLVTSTGEQIENPDVFFSDHIGGDIDEGVIKEGTVIWMLARGHAADIKWVKLKWSTKEGDAIADGARKEYAIKIELKK